MAEKNKVEWTAEDRARHRVIREKFKNQPTIDELVAAGELSGHPLPHGLALELRAMLHDLKKGRETAGLSLTELSERTGMDKTTLSQLENGLQQNPTLETLARYTAALGKRLRLAVEEVK